MTAKRSATTPLSQSQVTNLIADLAAKAPLASPALTGTPTVPTAPVGTGTTQAASTAFVLANDELPVPTPATEGFIAKIVNGQWVAVESAVTPAAAGFFPAAAAAGGRGIGVLYFTDDVTRVVSLGDQGGSAVCRDTSGLHPWVLTNNRAIDQNHDIIGNSLWQHPTTPGRAYKLTDGTATQSGFWRSDDYGDTWTRDTAANSPWHDQSQAGATAGGTTGAALYPRATGNLGVVDGAGNEWAATDTVPRRFRAGAWEDVNFPALPGTVTSQKPLCIIQNPNNRNEIWVAIQGHNSAANTTYTSYLYRTTTGNATTPTWTGPFTGISFPQEMRHTGTNLIALSVNPLAATGQHGLYVLDNATTAVVGATWTQVGPKGTTAGAGFNVFYPIRTVAANPGSSGGNTIVSLALRKIGGTTYIVAPCMGTNNADPLNGANPRAACIVGSSTSDFGSGDRGTWKGVGASQPNLINGQTGKPWNRLPAGTNAAGFSSTGLVYADIHPTNPDIVTFGGYQGFFRSTDMFVSATPTIYPIPYGAGGPVWVAAARDPNDKNKVYFGLSDEFLTQSFDGGIDPGTTLGETTPTAPASTTNQISGVLVETDTDGNVYVAAWGYPNLPDNYGVWVHKGISASNTWPTTGVTGAPAPDSAGWSNLLFPDGNDGFATPGDTTSGYYGLDVWKHTDGDQIVVAAQSGNGWYRKKGLSATPVKCVLKAGGTAPNDGQTRTNGSITSGSNVLTGSGFVTGSWPTATTASTNKPIVVRGAGPAGADLFTTITGFTSATQVTLAANASTTIASGGTYSLGGIQIPIANADMAHVADGDPHIAAYADGTGIYVSDDYAATWTFLSPSGTTITAVVTSPINLRNFAGYVTFLPGVSNKLIVANDVNVWLINDPFGTPAAAAIGAGIITRPGPIKCSATEMIVVQRNSATQDPEIRHAPIPTTWPPSPPNWLKYQDPYNRVPGSCSFARALDVYPAGDFIVSARGNGHTIYKAA